MTDKQIKETTLAGLRVEEIQRLKNLFKGLGGQLPITEDSIQEFIRIQRVTL